MENIAKVTVGIVAVSRDCFPAELSKKRRKQVVAACAARKVPIVEIETLVENEKDALAALAQISERKVNALVVYLGNFGPEGPATMMIQKFDGPVMVVAAAEETQTDLIGGRGDAYCGLLNTSYNLGLRGLRPLIPEHPVADADDIVKNIMEFIPCARIFLSVKNLKIFGFGPRPQDFLTCNAPIQPLFDLGVEIMENSELDLLDIVKAQEGAPEIESIAADMRRELGAGNTYSGLIDKLAQFESALLKFMDANLGASSFGIFANKCWPAFEKYFGHVPCYINSRMAARGIPVACETDIYGALSEYIALCATELAPTILDINNTVPKDMYEANKNKTGDYKASDLWMGFHCGNTPGSCMVQPSMKYQLIMHRLMEPGKEPDITRGTLEGRIKPGAITIFRLQSTARAELTSYIAEGDVLDIEPKSFGGIGVFAIKEMERFYRHVLVQKRFPHHTAVAFKHTGKSLFEVMKMLGVGDISVNAPQHMRYETENPFN
jgi:L-fucose isomerase-like protein